VTLFEKIASREIPAEILAEGPDWIAFRDIAPKAPVHFLVVPKHCIPRLNEAAGSDSVLLGKLLDAVATTARQEGLGSSGYRVVINNGPDGGETVPHLHIHVLGGRPMTWPPG
jgi:histidine triad (HIT) family protein